MPNPQLPSYPQRLCEIPATARLAQMILAAPIVPIKVAAVSLPEGAYNVTPYKIQSNGKPIPDKIYRSLQEASSHSVVDWLLAASRDPSLDRIDQGLFADFRAALVRIAAAGINDERIDKDMQGQLMAACHKITQKQDVPDWQNVRILGVSAPEAFQSLQEYATEISNRLVREPAERGRGDLGAG